MFCHWFRMKSERTFNFTSVRLSVRPSVRLSVRLSRTFLENAATEFFKSCMVVGMDDSTNLIRADFEKMDNPPVKVDYRWILMVFWP